MATITILVAVNKEKINTEQVQIECPEQNMYYRMFDDGNFFPEGEVLFAILPRARYEAYFNLVKVKRGVQLYDDFNANKDCKYEDWLSTETIRKIAVQIMSKSINGPEWQKITKEAFEAARTRLLNTPFEL